jgi:phosphate transport system substrate-binding protein
MMRKNMMSVLVILTLLGAAFAGCTGDDDTTTDTTTDNTGTNDATTDTTTDESYVINIAGSSTVFPVASAWAQAYDAANSNYNVVVAGGGSGAGASKVCSTDTDRVNIGDMSRGWKDFEVIVASDGYTYECLNSDITVTQLTVAVDGLSVIVKKDGTADQCLTAMGGISMAQLRWVYSDWSEDNLANHEEGGLDMASVTPNNDNDGVREWSDLDASSACVSQEINIWGADDASGTYEYFGEQVFCKDCFADGDPVAETFDNTDRRTNGYQNSAEDNVIVNGVSGDDNAIGYFGYAYYEENANVLSLVGIANNDTHGVQDAGGAVEPSPATVASGDYAPLARNIYMNVNNADWDLVKGFIEYGLSSAGQDHVADVGYVSLTSAQVTEMTNRVETASA